MCYRKIVSHPDKTWVTGWKIMKKDLVHAEEDPIMLRSLHTKTPCLTNTWMPAKYEDEHFESLHKPMEDKKFKGYGAWQTIKQLYKVRAREHALDFKAYHENLVVAKVVLIGNIRSAKNMLTDFTYWLGDYMRIKDWWLACKFFCDGTSDKEEEKENRRTQCVK